MHQRAACMSFEQLHVLAHGRAWSADESARFAALSQAEKNAVVRKLAAQAENVDVEDRIGADGVVYTAFWVRGTA